jgi:hypothetical protein
MVRVFYCSRDQPTLTHLHTDRKTLACRPQEISVPPEFRTMAPIVSRFITSDEAFMFHYGIIRGEYSPMKKQEVIALYYVYEKWEVPEGLDLTKVKWEIDDLKLVVDGYDKPIDSKNTRFDEIFYMDLPDAKMVSFASPRFEPTPPNFTISSERFGEMFGIDRGIYSPIKKQEVFAIYATHERWEVPEGLDVHERRHYPRNWHIDDLKLVVDGYDTLIDSKNVRSDPTHFHGKPAAKILRFK